MPPRMQQQQPPNKSRPWHHESCRRRGHWLLPPRLRLRLLFLVVAMMICSHRAARTGVGTKMNSGNKAARIYNFRPTLRLDGNTRQQTKPQFHECSCILKNHTPQQQDSITVQTKGKVFESIVSGLLLSQAIRRPFFLQRMSIASVTRTVIILLPHLSVFC
jgi:hypothetical protein